MHRVPSLEADDTMPSVRSELATAAPPVCGADRRDRGGAASRWLPPSRRRTSRSCARADGRRRGACGPSCRSTAFDSAPCDRDATRPRREGVRPDAPLRRTGRARRPARGGELLHHPRRASPAWATASRRRGASSCTPSRSRFARGKPRSGEKPPVTTSSRSRAWRRLRRHEGHRCAEVDSSRLRAGSARRSTRVPPWGGTGSNCGAAIPCSLITGHRSRTAMGRGWRSFEPRARQLV